MTDDLVTRLRNQLEFWNSGGRFEAAARIEQDAATIARLEGERDVALAANRGLVRLCEITEARADRLVDALEEIASYDTGATAGLAYTASAAIAAAKEGA